MMGLGDLGMMLDIDPALLAAGAGALCIGMSRGG